MRYSKIRKMDVSNGLGIGISLFTQGCSNRCPGCFNQETWDFDGGKNFSNREREIILGLLEPPYIQRLSILGGEPLDYRNYKELAILVKETKELYPNKQIWIYTGYLLENLREIDSEDLQYILNNIDILVDGPFLADQRDISLAFRGSKNQRIIDMNKTNQTNNIVLLEK